MRTLWIKTPTPTQRVRGQIINAIKAGPPGNGCKGVKAHSAIERALPPRFLPVHRKLIHLSSTILLSLSLSLVALGVNAEEDAEPIFLEVEDFPGLDDFESLEAFQAHIDRYVKQCRDTWISSSLGSRCGIEADLWDRELNVAYKALLGVLSTDAKEKLKSSQRSWISFRDETMDFSKLALALHYDDGQRMWVPIMSLDYSETLSKLTQARTLQLRRWQRQVENPVSGLM